MTNEATRLVSLWITNDSEHYHAARRSALDGLPISMGGHLTHVLKTAKPHTAAWHTAQELSPNDYLRVNWAEVSRDLRAE
jgi:hypothetical protein